MDVPAFLAHWGLTDPSSEAALLQLEPALQEKILAEFTPRPSTRDVNKLFHGFIRCGERLSDAGPGTGMPRGSWLNACMRGRGMLRRKQILR